jgi:fatty-acyl-CoA synthase
MQAPNNFGCCGTEELLFRKGEISDKEHIQLFFNGINSRKQMAYFKIPRYWIFKNQFPLTVTGKVKKFVMRDISIRELGL